MTLPRAALVNIDDLNAVGVIDDVHNTVEGKPLANPFAAADLALPATLYDSRNIMIWNKNCEKKKSVNNTSL